MNPQLEVIDAFIDGERVDAGALKNALAHPDGRAYLIDAWLLREAVQDDRHSAPVVAASPKSRPARRWLVAAAIGGSLAAGYGLGSATGNRSPQVAPQQTVTVEAAPKTAFPAPAPTRVIHLEFQNSTNTSGGD